MIRVCFEEEWNEIPPEQSDWQTEKQYFKLLD